MRYAITALTLSAIAGLPALNAVEAESGGYTVQVRGYAWWATPQDGDVELSSGTTDIDDANLDEAEIGYYIEAGVRLPLIPNVVVGHTSYVVESDGGADAELDVTNTYLEVSYGIPLLGYAGVSIGGSLHNLGAEIDDSGSLTVDEDAWIIALAGRAYVFPTDNIDLQARFQWSDLGDDSLLDLEALITYYPTSVIGIQGGYRLMQVELNDGDDLDVTLTGPFVGAALQF